MENDALIFDDIEFVPYHFKKLFFIEFIIYNIIAAALRLVTTFILNYTGMYNFSGSNLSFYLHEILITTLSFTAFFISWYPLKKYLNFNFLWMVYSYSGFIISTTIINIFAPMIKHYELYKLYYLLLLFLIPSAFMTVYVKDKVNNIYLFFGILYTAFCFSTIATSEVLERYFRFSMYNNYLHIGINAFFQNIIFASITGFYFIKAKKKLL